MLSRALAVGLGALALCSVIVLLVWDAAPGRFPVAAHFVLGAMPLALIAVSYLAYQAHRGPSRAEALRAAILAVAFLCWAENQREGEGRLATLWNDLAIALFVLDVSLTMAGWPPDGAKSPEPL